MKKKKLIFSNSIIWTKAAKIQFKTFFLLLPMWRKNSLIWGSCTKKIIKRFIFAVNTLQTVIWSCEQTFKVTIWTFVLLRLYIPLTHTHTINIKNNAEYKRAYLLMRERERKDINRPYFILEANEKTISCWNVILAVISHILSQNTV